MKTSTKIVLTILAFVGIAPFTAILANIVNFLITKGYIQDSTALGVIMLIVIVSAFTAVNYLIWRKRK